MTPLRHAILGAGGVGGVMAAFLAHVGESVTLVVRPESVGSYPAEIQLESPFAKFRVPVTHDKGVPSVDVLWIAVKATQLESALQTIPKPDIARAIVPLLNGIDHLALLRGKYGKQRVIPATIAGEMERLALGHFVHRTPFLFLQVLSTGRELLAATMGGLQKEGLECRFIDDEPTLMWSKMVFLAPMALSSTASGLAIGGVRDDPTWRSLWESCVRETCAIAIAEGAQIDADAVLARMSQAPPGMRSSMQKDVEAGRTPELDAIAGPILRGGVRHGIATPATEKLAAGVAARTAEEPVRSS
jgi:2-dehydropantoate 2-reductase